MSESKKYYGFAGLRRDAQGKIASFSIGGDLTQVKATAEYIESESTIKAVEDQTTLKDKHPALLLKTTMSRMVNAVQSQFELLFMTSLLQSLSSSYFLGNDVVKPLEEANCEIENYGNITIFGLSQEMFRVLSPKIERLQRVDRGLEALPAALLRSLVATFDSNVADVVRDMLTIKSELSQTGSKTILLSKVLQFESIAEVKEKVIADEVYLFSRGSHEEQIDFIEKNFHIAIKSHWKR